MTESRRAQVERGVGLAMAVLAALVAVTCGSRGALEHGPLAPLAPPPASLPSAARSPQVALPEADGAAASGAEPAPAPSAIVDPERLALRQFFADLEALEQRRRATSVRIHRQKRRETKWRGISKPNRLFSNSLIG